MKTKIPTPTLRGTAAPELEVRIQFHKGQGWQVVIHDGYEERGRSKFCETFRAAVLLAAESLEAAQ